MLTAWRIVSVAFALFFLGSALGKLDGWASWRESSRRWMPGAVPTKILQVGLPAAEGALAIVLVSAPATGLWAAAVFLTILAVGAAALIPSHRGNECGCFGTLTDGRIGWGLVARNVVLATASMGAAIAGGKALDSALPLPFLLLGTVLGTITLLGLEASRRDLLESLRPKTTQEADL